MVRASAIAPREDGAPGRQKIDPSVRITLEGVGSVEGNFECNVADKSSRTAAGVVNGR
jgi:hypothetical protein